MSCCSNDAGDRVTRPAVVALFTRQGSEALDAASRAPSPLPYPPTPELYLHVGCGPVVHPMFVNVDAIAYPHVHHVRPIDDLSPIADGSAALLYACHCLEHLPMAAVPEALAEWRRVLRPSRREAVAPGRKRAHHVRRLVGAEAPRQRRPPRH